MQLDINLSPPQGEIFNNTKRFKVAVCGRRFGKTYLAGIILLLKAVQQVPSFSMAVAPTYKQLTDPKDGIFTLLKRIIPRQLIRRVSETNLTIELKNGSVIQCRSGDAQQQDSLRGGGLDLLVLDEYADLDPQVWTLILAPRLADTQGSALFIGTPRGYTHFYDLWKAADSGLENWAAFQYTTLDGGRVAAEEVNRFRSLLSKTEFEQEFLAKFTSLTGRVYSNFSDLNYRAITNDTASPLWIGIDFNTAPNGLSVVVSQKRGPIEGAVSVLKAFSFQGTTPELATRLKALYPNQKIICCPDPAGGQNNTTGTTDWKLLEAAGFEVRGKKYHVEIKNRTNNVQSNLCAEDGTTVRLFVNNTDCEPLIKTFMGQVYDEKGLPGKGNGLEHMGDAIGYLLWETSNLFRQKVEFFRFSPAA